jgi:hypothetical protein
MKTVAYALYVVVVLLISGLARANAATTDTVTTQYGTPLQIAQISLDATRSELLIAGSLPNPCYGNPSATLTQDMQNPTVLTLHLTSPAPMHACVAQVKSFDTSLILPILIQASRINIENIVVYTLKVEGSEIEMKVLGSQLIK